MDALILASGIVESVGRSALCHVNLANERRAICQIAGRMRRVITWRLDD